MATVPQFFRRTAVAAGAEAPVTRTESARKERDPFLLRTIPQEDVFFYCKRIDNSRLVREADPDSRHKCWSAIGAACLALALLTGVLRSEERRVGKESRSWWLPAYLTKHVLKF